MPESTAELESKIASLLANKKFKKNYWSIAVALNGFKTATVLSNAGAALDELGSAIEKDRKNTYFWQVFRKAKLSALSKYVAAQRQLLPKSVPRSLHEIYESETKDLVQGPRIKSDATIAL